MCRKVDLDKLPGWRRWPLDMWDTLKAGEAYEVNWRNLGFTDVEHARRNAYPSARIRGLKVARRGDRLYVYRARLPKQVRYPKPIGRRD